MLSSKKNDLFQQEILMQLRNMISMAKCIVMSVVAASAHAEDYLFVGTFDVPSSSKSYWCRDVGMETLPIKKHEDYAEAKKTFYAAQKGNSPSVYLFSPDMAAVIYQYKTFSSGFNCEKEILSVYKANDVAAAKAQMEKRRQKEPRHFRSDPKAVLTWTGSEYKSELKKDYNGVEITYTSRSKDGKTFVIAKGRNTNRDKVAAVVFSDTGIKSDRIVLQPGAGFTHPIGSVSDFSVEVGFGEPAAEGQEPSTKAINYIKEKVRDNVTTKDGRMKSLAAIGSRG